MAGGRPQIVLRQELRSTGKQWQQRSPLSDTPHGCHLLVPLLRLRIVCNHTPSEGVPPCTGASLAVAGSTRVYNKQETFAYQVFWALDTGLQTRLTPLKTVWWFRRFKSEGNCPCEFL